MIITVELVYSSCEKFVDLLIFAQNLFFYTIVNEKIYVIFIVVMMIDEYALCFADADMLT